MRTLTTLLCAAALGCGADETANTAPIANTDTSSQPDGQTAATDAPSPEPELPDPFAELVLVDVQATVHYEGAFTGPLQVGVFKTYPATGGPVAFKRIDEPIFPQTLTLKNVEKGTWYVVARVDQAPDSPTLPGPEDPQGSSEAIVIESADDTPSTTLHVVVP